MENLAKSVLIAVPLGLFLFGVIALISKARGVDFRRPENRFYLIHLVAILVLCVSTIDSITQTLAPGLPVRDPWNDIAAAVAWAIGICLMIIAAKFLPQITAQRGSPERWFLWAWLLAGSLTILDHAVIQGPVLFYKLRAMGAYG
jgi:hypothetical protein